MSVARKYAQMFVFPPSELFASSKLRFQFEYAHSVPVCRLNMITPHIIFFWWATLRSDGSGNVTELLVLSPYCPAMTVIKRLFISKFSFRREAALLICGLLSCQTSTTVKYCCCQSLGSVSFFSTSIEQLIMANNWKRELWTSLKTLGNRLPSPVAA